MIAFTFLPGLGVVAAVDEPEVAVGVLREAVALHVNGPGGRSIFTPLAEERVLRVEVEEVVPLQLEQRLRDRQLAQVRPCRAGTW